MSTKRGSFLFRGGRIYDARRRKFVEADVWVEGDVIRRVGKIGPDEVKAELVDAGGWILAPGFIDIHVHLREPGREDAETIFTGAQAAMAGGFTAVCAMPNTNPAIDNRGMVEFVRERAEGLLVDVFPIGAVTKGRKGEELAEMGDMLEAGAVAFSDDGSPVSNTEILRYALEYSRMFRVPIIDHCEDPFLSKGRVMNEGRVSTRLGFAATPPLAEDLLVIRDIMMAEFTGGHAHIAHISSGRAVELVRQAKARGVKVTAEATPHHFCLTDEHVATFDTNLRVNPPLRSEEDRQAVIEGLADGTIDAIVTDHAPHTIEEKDVEFDAAAPGLVGLETSVGLALTELVHKGRLSLEQLVEKMALRPRKILGLRVPEIREGEPANLTFLDPQKEWVVDKTAFKSRSRNTPFHGWKLRGKAAGVFNHGQLYLAEENV
ncbi:MAG TPA: dihydroorotase [Bacteroidetes bacterium]|nr:dihydroorotase [Bacteroidota bacterium]